MMCEDNSCKSNQMTLNEAIEHAESCVNDTPCGQAHKQLADWLKELRDMKSRNVGNAAAMREALETLLNLAWVVQDENSEGGPRTRVPEQFIIEVAKSALSAPARNCDKMPDIDNLTLHDLAKSPCKSTLEYASREELLALVRWLLAPAAERKGEGDGR